MLNETVRLLHDLNYSKLIRLDLPHPENYSFNEYRAANFQHPPTISYCTSCEDIGANAATDDSGFTLQHISHGAHSVDFLQSCTPKIDTAQWHNAGVLFLFESPSTNGGIYESVRCNGCTKKPTREWYWIHRDHTSLRYPDSFRGRTYGDLVRSAILTFRLANAYATNLVKCGMNDETGDKFRPLAAFPQRCIQNCYEKVLSREIEILKPRVIFTFGSAVGDQLHDLLADQSIRIQHLPHPARGRSGFKDEYYEALYLWLMARALVAEGILSKEELDECVSRFIENAPPITKSREPKK